LLDSVQPPLGFRQIQAADFSDWQGEEDAPVLEQLLRDLGTARARHGSSIPSASFSATPRAAPKQAGKLPKFAVWSVSGGVLAVILALLVGRSLGSAPRRATASATAVTASPTAVAPPASATAVTPAPSDAVVPPTFVESQAATEQRQLLQTLRAYFRDLNAGTFDAKRYFAPNISLYIAMKNTSPKALNQYFDGFFPAHYQNFRAEMLEQTVQRRGPRVFTFREVSQFTEVAKQNRHREVVAEDRVTLDEDGKIIRFEQTHIRG